MREIESLRDVFRHAHDGISFSPEKRAGQCVEEFSAELAADLEELGDRAGNYVEKYVSWLRVWAGRKSRCMSTMITGPSNFPTAQNEKRFNAEERAWNEFRAWRKRYIRRATAERTKSPEEEIDSALIKLEKAQAGHQTMLAINRIVRGKGTAEEKHARIKEVTGLSDDTIEKIMTPDPLHGAGVPSFHLVSSNARIKRLKEKLEIMRSRIVARKEFVKIIFSGGSIDIENDRVVIRHDAKPSRDVIDSLKANGFHWSPSTVSWCRKHTAAAIDAAKRIVGVV